MADLIQTDNVKYTIEKITTNDNELIIDFLKQFFYKVCIIYKTFIHASHFQNIFGIPFSFFIYSACVYKTLSE